MGYNPEEPNSTGRVDRTLDNVVIDDLVIDDLVIDDLGVDDLVVDGTVIDEMISSDPFINRASDFLIQRDNACLSDDTSLELVNVDKDVADIWDEFELLAGDIAACPSNYDDIVGESLEGLNGSAAEHIASKRTISTQGGLDQDLDSGRRSHRARANYINMQQTEINFAANEELPDDEQQQELRSESRVTAISPRSTFRRLTRRFASAAAVACLAVVFYGSYYGQGQHYQAVAGTQQNIQLDDGSEIILASGGELNLYEGWGRRHVELEHGVAYFSVAKNPNKPFTVDSGPSQVRVLGTAFTVYHKADYVEVVVESGKVNVSNTEGTGSDSGQSYNIDLIKQEKVVIGIDGELRKEDHVKLNEEMGWRKGVVYFKNETLASIISRMSDFYDEPIQIINNKHRNTKLTGAFKSNNIEKFLHALQTISDVKVERGQGGSVLIY